MCPDDELDTAVGVEPPDAQMPPARRTQGGTIPRHFADIARRSILLAGLPRGVTAQLLSRATVRSFGRGEMIFLQNEPARHIYIVLDGWVKLNRMTESGVEAVIAVFSTAQSFAESVGFQGYPYPVNAEAVSDCTLLQIETGMFVDLVRSDPDCVGPVFSAMYHHLHSLILQIEALKARTGSQRVASFLLELCNATIGAAEVVLPHDKMLVAGRLGMKPESLSRAFSRLRRDAGVEIRGNLVKIPDIAALRHFSVRDPALAWSKSGGDYPRRNGME